LSNGASQPFGDWFVDASAGVWLFTENSNFFRGHVRGEDPIRRTLIGDFFNSIEPLRTCAGHRWGLAVLTILAIPRFLIPKFP
jgi:hypothetical protein